MRKKIIAMLVISILVCFLTSCGVTEEESATTTYSKNGMSITMDNGFIENEVVSLTYYLQNQNNILTALKESFTDLHAINITADSTLENYAQAILDTNYIDAIITLSESNKYTWFSYNKSLSGKDYYYLATCHKANDSFWLIQFACETKNTEIYNEKFHTWADSVVFVDVTI